jgi:hypothetical protein
MAFTTTEPIIIQQVNWWNFENAHVLTRQQAIILDCRRGYLAPDATVPIEYDIVSCSVDGEAYAEALSANVAGGLTLGEAVVAAAYSLLRAAGVIPENATEVG